MKTLIIILLFLISVPSYAQWVFKVDSVTALPPNPVDGERYIYQGSIFKYMNGGWYFLIGLALFIIGFNKER